MRVWPGLVVSLIGVLSSGLGCKSSDDDGGGGGTDGASGMSAGKGGAPGRAGSGGAAGSSPRPSMCRQLCARGMTMCGADQAQCEAECGSLVAVTACATEVDAVIACQLTASASCDADELVIEGCDDDAITAASCVMEAGGPVVAGASGNGSGGSGSGGASGGGGSGGSGPLEPGEAIPRIGDSCERLCECAGGVDCMDLCRATGTTHLDCAAEYIALVDCGLRSCGMLSDPLVTCASEVEAWRACNVPVAPSTALSCTGACDSRLQPGCMADVARDLCADNCDAAEAKPECDTVVSAYASCASSSRNVCLPSGQISTECFDEVRALQDCAGLSAAADDCGSCVSPSLDQGGACFAAYDACGDGFMDCTVERVCLEDCLFFSLSDPSDLQTLESCAERCGAGEGDPDPLGFRSTIDCVACECTEACAPQQATCN